MNEIFFFLSLASAVTGTNPSQICKIDSDCAVVESGDCCPNTSVHKDFAERMRSYPEQCSSSLVICPELVARCEKKRCVTAKKDRKHP